jgi:uncharacterized protein with HEPN domain
MNDRDQLFLDDIVEAIEAIQRYAAVGADAFRADELKHADA